MPHTPPQPSELEAYSSRASDSQARIKTPHGDIVFTQHDVRSLQLAKGAIHSGWELLLDSLGVPLEEPSAAIAFTTLMPETTVPITV